MALSFKKQNRSAFVNFLRAKYEMFTEVIKVNALPYYLCLDPSDKCQLRCPTCPTGIENESRRRKDGEMTIYRKDRSKLSVELCNSLLDELGENLFLVMLYNYGEPLLNPHLPELIRAATDREIATELHSNLSLTLTDRRIEELLAAGIDRLAASVDGFSQQAYEVHRVGGNIKLVHDNLRRLAVARDRLGLDTEITYNFLIFKHNEHEIDEARKFALDIGIEFCARDAVVNDPSWLPSHRLQEQPYYSREEQEAIAERWEPAERNDYFFAHEDHQVWSPLPKQREGEFPRTCGWHYGFSVVTGGGPVSPCCAMPKDKDDFGTVVPGVVSFADIWNNEYYQKSRLAMTEQPTEGLDHVDPICTRCYVPKFVHHLYNAYDGLVTQRFREVFGESEPEMSKAFALLDESSGGINSSAFVAHYERHLSELCRPHQAPPAGSSLV